MSILDISPIGKDFLKRLLQKDPRKRIDAKCLIISLTIIRMYLASMAL